MHLHPLKKREIQKYHQKEQILKEVKLTDNIPNKPKDVTYVISLDSRQKRIHSIYLSEDCARSIYFYNYSKMFANIYYSMEYLMLE